MSGMCPVVNGYLSGKKGRKQKAEWRDKRISPHDGVKLPDYVGSLITVGYLTMNQDEEDSRDTN